MPIVVDNSNQDVLDRFPPKKVAIALALLTFDEINKLRVINGDQPYTLAQFKQAILTKIKTLP